MKNILKNLQEQANPEKAEQLQRFFKTGKGQYAEGDIFWGITVPSVRAIAHKYKDLEVTYIEKLLSHKIHEARLCALLIMVFQAKENPMMIFDLYLKNRSFINNWDLVDLSAPVIVGNFLLNKEHKILFEMARSPLLWDRRIAIISTFAFIKHGDYKTALKISRILINDSHDLIHKAVGWMLREVGKRCSQKVLEDFLKEHAVYMPRTMLRYAIEHLGPERKRYFMEAKRKISESF